jgi:hypothetical protein
MASQQDYLDDLERKHLVQVTTNEKGEKVYTVPHSLLPPAFYCQPYTPDVMFPEQWRDRVLVNFEQQFLAWWYNAFRALKSQQDAQAFDDGSTKGIGVELNKETGLFEPRK